MPDQKASADPEVAPSTAADADSLLGLFAGANGRFSLAGLKTYLLGGLATFTSAAKGLVPASGGGTINFLRADGSWVSPSAAKSNFAATVPPTATDDSDAGYVAGSSWMIPALGLTYRCRSAVVGAARWFKVDVADHPGYVAGRTYIPFGMGMPSGGVAGSTNGLTFVGFGILKERVTISRLGIRITTASAGGSYNLMIYAHDPVGMKPTGLPLAVSVVGSTATAGPSNVDLTTPITLEPGGYWFGLQTNSNAYIYILQNRNSTQFASMIGCAVDAIGFTATDQPSGYAVTGTYGTVVDMTTATLVENSSRMPLIQFTVASVP